MDAITRRKIFDLHSWFGVTTSIVIFVVAFSGMFALFAEGPLREWADPALRGKGDWPKASVQAMIDDALTETPKAAQSEFALFLGHTQGRGITITFEVDDKGDQAKLGGDHLAYAYDSVTGARLARVIGNGEADTEEKLEAAVAGDMTDFLVKFHTDLWLPSPYGRYGTGLLGLTLTVSIIAGFLIYRSKLKNMFTMRVRLSPHIRYQDVHRTIGLFGLPFFALLSFSGTLLSFAGDFYIPVAAVVKYGGDEDKLLSALISDVDPATTKTEKRASIDDMYAAGVERAEGFDPSFLFAYNYGHENAVLDVYGYKEKRMSPLMLKFDGASGEVLGETIIIKDAPMSSGVINSLESLHFASFGGMLMKFLYALFAAGLCIMVALGGFLWLERRGVGAPNALPTRIHDSLKKMFVAVFAGTPLATLSLFYSEHVLAETLMNRVYWMGCVFFSILAAALMVSATTSVRRSGALMMALTGVLALGAPIAQVIGTGQTSFSAAATGHPAALGVDVMLMLFGVAFLYSAWRMSERTGFAASNVSVEAAKGETP